MDSFPLLSPEQRRILEVIATLEDLTLQRRARLLLHYAAGEPTRQVAGSVKLSRGRARYWRHQFVLRGLSIFPAEVISLEAETLDAGTKRGDSKTKSIKPGVETQFNEDSIHLMPIQSSHPINPDEIEVDSSVEKKSTKKGRKKEKLPAWVIAARGLPLPDPINKPGVLPTDSLAEAGRKVFRYQFTEMLSHEAGTRQGEDIEALHDMRVATRRMRAAFDVFGEAYDPAVVKLLLKSLRLTGRTLGRVRDLDVFMEKAGVYLQKLPAEHADDLHSLLEDWSRQRDTARSVMLAHLDGIDYQDFLTIFNAFVQTTGAGSRAVPTGELGAPGANLVREIVPAQVFTRLGQVRAFDAILSNATLPQLHALRIEFKKLRYTVEYFREVLGTEAKAIIDDLKRMQDHLGELNDANVACQLINAFLQELDMRQASLPLAERQNPEPLVAYLAFQVAERHRLMLSFPEQWVYFNRPEFRANLAKAIAIL